MKTLARIFTFSMFVILPSTLFAEGPGAVGPLGPPPETDRIGVIAAVKGQVEIKDTATVGRVAASGAPVYLGDTVSTDGVGQLQILLKDETIFTIGPNSSILIDAFIYDPATGDGKVSAEILKGTFRFVTGKIAKKKPENMAVKLPVGTLGVRGTMVAGRVDGEKSVAVLLGPGPQNQAGEPAGSFVLNNIVNNQVQSTHVTGMNFGSEIAGANQPPVAPFRVPDAMIESICNNFGAPPAYDAAGPPSPTGQPTTPGQQGAYPANFTNPHTGERGNFESALQRANVRIGDLANFDRISLLASQNRIKELQALAPDDATTFEELRSLNDGAFHYEDFGPPGPTGVITTRTDTTFNFEANINFSTDVFGGTAGTGSRITNATSDIGLFNFPLDSNCTTCNYNPAAFSGAAGFFYSNIDNVSVGECANCAADVSIGLGNINTQVGPGAGVQNLAVVAVQLIVTIKDGPNGNVLAQISEPARLAQRQQGVANGTDD